MSACRKLGYPQFETNPVCSDSLLPRGILIGFRNVQTINVTWPRDKKNSEEYVKHQKFQSQGCNVFQLRTRICVVVVVVVVVVGHRHCGSSVYEIDQTIVGQSMRINLVVQWSYNGHTTHLTDENPVSSYFFVWTEGYLGEPTHHPWDIDSICTHMTGECWLCTIRVCQNPNVGRISECSHELNRVKSQLFSAHSCKFHVCGLKAVVHLQMQVALGRHRCQEKSRRRPIIDWIPLPKTEKSIEKWLVLIYHLQTMFIWGFDYSLLPSPFGACL